MPRSGSRRVLGLFAKQPLPGQVKTRLATQTSPDWAAAVATAFLHDSVDRLARIDAERILAHAPADAAAYFTSLVAGRFDLMPQGEGDLGARLTSFFEFILQSGPARIVVVGADSPTLPLPFVEQAFDALNRVDVVLGPATDGGYYLIGCASRVPPIFDGIAWSSSQVLSQTVRRLNGTVWRVALLPPWYDVDTLEDWHLLHGHLTALRLAGIDPQAPHTERLL